MWYNINNQNLKGEHPMNYGELINDAMLKVRQAKVQEEQKKLERKLESFMNKWLADAENGTTQDFSRVFEADISDIFALRKWCESHGLEVERCGGVGKYKISLAKDIV